LNELARAQMRAAGDLRGADQVVATERGERAFAAGDRIMFQRNERGLGGNGGGRDGVAVKNGTLGTVLEVAAGGERLTVRVDGPGRPGRGQEEGDSREVTFYVRDYAHIDHGYAATVHKAQGVTVDRAHVLATPHMDRHAAYVGLTRHRDGVALHYAREDFPEPARLARTLGRERAKDTGLDYDREDELVRRYAARRGMAPESEIIVREREQPALRRGRFAGLALDAVSVERERAPEPAPGLAETVAAGRAGFRERFEAHRRQQAQERAQALELARVQALDQAAARELVGQWDRVLAAYSAALPRLEADPTLGGTREQMALFARGVREQPGAARVLREQGEAFGMAERPNLARIVSAREPERVVGGIMAKAEDGMREHLRAEAEREAVRQRELEAARLAPRRDRGPSLGW
jgi:hypothetical protein